MWNWKEHGAYLEVVQDLLEDEAVQSMGALPQHAQGVSCLHHSIMVSYFSFCLCRALGLDARAAARGGLLHDLYLYNWRDPEVASAWGHLLRHPAAALCNARTRFFITAREADIIATHMFPLTINKPYHCLESLMVSTMDKVCAVAELLHLVPHFSLVPTLQPKEVIFFRPHLRTQAG